MTPFLLHPSLAPRRRARLWRVLLALVVVLFLALNALAFLHARSITHYGSTETRTTRMHEVRTLRDKARLIFLGPRIRRMANTKSPAEFGLPFEDRRVRGLRGQQIAVWRIPGQPGRPVVVLFHGYGGSRDTLLRPAAEFHAAGCETWLVDFCGSGDSEGSVVTLGWREAEDVAAVARLAREEHRGPVIAFGTSMGAVAILTAQHRGLFMPDAMILECPFDRLDATLGNRLELMGIPRNPLAPAVAFWIGVQHGFNGLAHRPVAYARATTCPVLLLQGENDRFVGGPALQAFAAAFGDKAQVKMLPNAGHAGLLRDAPTPWREAVRALLAQTSAWR